MAGGCRSIYRAMGRPRWPTTHLAGGAGRLVGHVCPARSRSSWSSAHWETAPASRSSATRTVPAGTTTSGASPTYYQVTYPAPGAPALAGDGPPGCSGPRCTPVAHLPGRGLDHGAYVPLVEMYPRADVPVLQMSMPTLDPRELMDVGRKLAPLRDDGVLIMGSGFFTHNLREIVVGSVPPVIAEFDDWGKAILAPGDVDALIDFARQAPAARLAHPRTEHFAPLFVTLGAAAGRPGRAAPGHRRLLARPGQTLHRDRLMGAARVAAAKRPPRTSAGTSTESRIRLAFLHGLDRRERPGGRPPGRGTPGGQRTTTPGAWNWRPGTRKRCWPRRGRRCSSWLASGRRPVDHPDRRTGPTTTSSPSTTASGRETTGSLPEHLQRSVPALQLGPHRGKLRAAVHLRLPRRLPRREEVSSVSPSSSWPYSGLTAAWIAEPATPSGRAPVAWYSATSATSSSGDLRPPSDRHDRRAIMALCFAYQFTVLLPRPESGGRSISAAWPATSRRAGYSGSAAPRPPNLTR